MSNSVPPATSDENKAEQAQQEKRAVAADYLGYSQDAAKWSPQILGEKYARILEHAEFLRACSDESRLDILIFLMHSNTTTGQLPRYSVSEVAERFNISMSTVSHHLQELKRANIVKMERSGKERYYQIDLDYMIERVGNWYRRLLTKREMLRQGLVGCPEDFSLEVIIKRRADEDKDDQRSHD